MDKCGLLVVLLLAASAVMGAVPAPKAAKADVLVGAYYFPGWNKAEKWYCIEASKNTWHPLLGYYDESNPEAADWHIKWAAEHGVSFFAFDFYTAGGSQMLETALDDGFLRAKHISKFKFCLCWCNHAPESTMTTDELDRFGDLVVRKYLTHPSYLRIDGRPVVMFLVGHAFIRNLGVEDAKKAFDKLKQKAKDAGLPGIYLVFCHDAMGPNEIEACRSVGVDAFARYNYPYQGTGLTGPGKHAEFSYRHLMSQGEAMWKQWRELTGGDYWPTVMAGWDRRPWTKDEDVVITGMTPELFGESLSKARGYVGKDRVVMIEAWNEWGEGSVLEPSVEHGFAYLDAVRRVFCPAAAGQDARGTSVQHMDVPDEQKVDVPDERKVDVPGEQKVDMPGERSAPVFDVKLPTADTWRFDSDAEGWTASGIDGLHNEWGALVGTTTSSDPSLTGPATYLQCKRYSKARVRMRAVLRQAQDAQLLRQAQDAQGLRQAHVLRQAQDAQSYSLVQEATGQLFWSTTEHGMGEARSVTFKVKLDGRWHEYELDLAANPNWKGMTDRLRFDPVDAAGVEFVVDEIRLVR